MRIFIQVNRIIACVLECILTGLTDQLKAIRSMYFYYSRYLLKLSSLIVYRVYAK